MTPGADADPAGPAHSVGAADPVGPSDPVGPAGPVGAGGPIRVPDDAPRLVSKRGIWTQRVRYVDTDRAAVVHHAAYLSFLEAGRIELFRENGFDYAKFERDTGTGMPVVECTLRFRAPARFDDLLEVATEIVEASRFSAWFRGVVRREGMTLVESRVRLACVSMTTEAPLRMPTALYEACLLPGFRI